MQCAGCNTNIGLLSFLTRKQRLQGAVDPSNNLWKYCQYLYFWWSYKLTGVTNQNIDGDGLWIVTRAIPNDGYFGDELLLLEKDTNRLKAA